MTNVSSLLVTVTPDLHCSEPHPPSLRPPLSIHARHIGRWWGVDDDEAANCPSVSVYTIPIHCIVAMVCDVVVRRFRVVDSDSKAVYTRARACCLDCEGIDDDSLLHTHTPIAQSNPSHPTPSPIKPLPKSLLRFRSYTSVKQHTHSLVRR